MAPGRFIKKEIIPTSPSWTTFSWSTLKKNSTFKYHSVIYFMDL